MQGAKIAILSSALIISLLHPFVPHHWLPIVILGRFRNWRLKKALGVTILASLFHVGVTLLLGTILILGGKLLLKEEDFHTAGSLILFGLGMLYLLRHFLGKKDEHTNRISQKTSLLTIYILLGASPCEMLFPIFLQAYGAGGIGLLLGIFALFCTLTVIGMALLVGIFLAGAQRLNFAHLEKIQHGVLGGVLLILGTFSVLCAP